MNTHSDIYVRSLVTRIAKNYDTNRKYDSFFQLMQDPMFDPDYYIGEVEYEITSLMKKIFNGKSYFGLWAYTTGEHFESMDKQDLNFFEACSLGDFILKFLDLKACSYELFFKDKKYFDPAFHPEFLFKQAYTGKEDHSFVIRPMYKKEVLNFLKLKMLVNGN